MTGIHRVTRRPLVTYQNMSGSPVTLAVSLSSSAPAGMFTLSADTVTVPADGTATLNLTANTNLDVPGSEYTGYLVAQSPAGTVTTPFALRSLLTHDRDCPGQGSHQPGQPAAVARIKAITGEIRASSACRGSSNSMGIFRIFTTRAAEQPPGHCGHPAGQFPEPGVRVE
jgi:hypothetical protein